LVNQANKKGLTGERKYAYVYGTLNKIEQKAQGHNSANDGDFLLKRRIKFDAK
jgi:hypothetical protein